MDYTLHTVSNIDMRGGEGGRGRRERGGWGEGDGEGGRGAESGEICESSGEDEHK